jgi:hypothetical protein
MTRPPPDELDAEFVAEFNALYDDAQPIRLEISKYQAWCLMAAVQLAARHPSARETRPVSEAINIALGLQGSIAATPRLEAVAQAGWES